METRVVIFLVLSLTILVGYEFLLKELGLAPQQSRQTTAKPVDTGTAAGESSVKPEPAPPASDAAGQPTIQPSGPAARPAPSASSASDTAERIEEVTTPLYRASFTNRGGEITDWALLRYLSSDPEQRTPVQLVHKEGKFRGPLSLQVLDPGQSKLVHEGLYRVERDFTALDPAHPTGHLTFRYEAADSPIRVVKELTFHHDSYLVDIAIRTEGLTGPVDVGLGTNFGVVEWGEGFIGLIGPASSVDDKVEKTMPDGEAERSGAVRWMALQDKYFLAVLMPTGAAAVHVRKEGDKLVSARVRFPAQATGQYAMTLYAGPKEFDTLKGFDVGLEETIDFGWFIYGSWDIVKAVAKPLFSVLRAINGVTHNFGVTIVLLTVAIKLLFVPLQYKSYKSMKEMQVIQPKVVALQNKFKDDRERLNKELIKLYRDHKVNPVGGCLPMLLQMPVFVALFNILYMTIDLRQAPFILWITDLSVQDPYYVLPIIMGVTMVVQQKIMPTTMDPVQAKAMLILPAFMTILFVTFPAGLVLYWVTNNALTIGQQFVTDRYIYKKPADLAASGDDAEGGVKAGGKKKKDKVADAAEPEPPTDS